MAAFFASISGWLTPLLTILSLIFGIAWFMVCLWESHTLQHYIRNRRMVRKARKIARLRAKEKVIVAQLDALEAVRVAKAEAKEKVAAAVSEAAVLVVQEEAKAKASLPSV